MIRSGIRKWFLKNKIFIPATTTSRNKPWPLSKQVLCPLDHSTYQQQGENGPGEQAGSHPSSCTELRQSKRCCKSDYRLLHKLEVEQAGEEEENHPLDCPVHILMPGLVAVGEGSLSHLPDELADRPGDLIKKWKESKRCYSKKRKKPLFYETSNTTTQGYCCWPFTASNWLKAKSHQSLG